MKGSDEVNDIVKETATQENICNDVADRGKVFDDAAPQKFKNPKLERNNKRGKKNKAPNAVMNHLMKKEAVVVETVAWKMFSSSEKRSLYAIVTGMLWLGWKETYDRF